MRVDRREGDGARGARVRGDPGGMPRGAASDGARTLPRETR